MENVALFKGYADRVGGVFESRPFSQRHPGATAVSAFGPNGAINHSTVSLTGSKSYRRRRLDPANRDGETTMPCLA